MTVLTLKEENTAPMNSTIQEELVKGCINEDRAAQRKLFEMFYGKMMGVCLRYSTDKEQAKDFLQEGFLKIFQNIKKFGNQGSLEGWIRRIMVNHCIDYHRKKKPEFEFLDNLNYEDNGIADEKYSEDEPSVLCAEDIIRAVQELSPGYRMVFNLYAIEDFTHQEISERLGISIGTSKSNLAKARVQLQKILKQSVVTK